LLGRSRLVVFMGLLVMRKGPMLFTIGDYWGDHTPACLPASAAASWKLSTRVESFSEAALAEPLTPV